MSKIRPYDPTLARTGEFLKERFSPKVENKNPLFTGDAVSIGGDKPLYTRPRFPVSPSAQVHAFVSDLSGRLDRDPMSLSPGDYVALLSGEEKKQEVVLMKILSAESCGTGRVVTYEGAVIDETGDNCRVRPASMNDKPHARVLWKSDKVVPLRPEEFREVCASASPVPMPHLWEVDGVASRIFASMLGHKKDVIVLGNVAV